MKTAALLPTPGDPFLVKHWLVNCREVWRDEVDEVRVLVGGQPNEEARAYLRREVEAIGGVYMERATGGLVPHGVALNILITDTDADAVLLLEDDVRVRRAGAIREVFTGLGGKYDVAASPRVSMTPGIEKAARKKWGDPDVPDDGDGHGMWPAFVFAPRAALLATDRDYGERSWGPRMVVPGLGYRVPESGIEVCDTFGGAAFQLRAANRVRGLPQWKGPWLWQMWLAEQRDMEWFHIGSLSSSSNLLADWDGPGGFEFLDARTLTDHYELGEWAHRLAWWGRCYLLHGGEFPGHALSYARNLDRLRERMGVPVERIEEWGRVIDAMVTWDEA